MTMQTLTSSAMRSSTKTPKITPAAAPQMASADSMGKAPKAPGKTVAGFSGTGMKSGKV